MDSLEYQLMRLLDRRPTEKRIHSVCRNTVPAGREKDVSQFRVFAKKRVSFATAIWIAIFEPTHESQCCVSYYSSGETQ